VEPPRPPASLAAVSGGLRVLSARSHNNNTNNRSNN
jgi:hypothetical protein